jgi:hypothetical protein
MGKYYYSSSGEVFHEWHTAVTKSIVYETVGDSPAGGFGVPETITIMRAIYLVAALAARHPEYVRVYWNQIGAYHSEIETTADHISQYVGPIRTTEE